MNAESVFWAITIGVVIGVVVSLINRSRQSRQPPRPAPSDHMQFHAHTDTDAHDSATPRLICLSGDHQGHTLAIPPGGLSVGRAKDNLLIIVHGRISRHHAWIGVVEGGVMLRDYQSLSGTYLNGDLNTRVGDALLADGDIIHFGGEGGEEFRLVVG